MQTPTGGNRQEWHFMVLTDADKKQAIADLYRKGFETYATQPGQQYQDDDPRAAQMPRVVDSAMHLVNHLQDVPALILACIEGRVEEEGVFAQASLYGSILPAAWSLMIALRTRGIGATWTTLHLFHEQAAAQLLGIPAHVTQTVLLPIAYFTGNDLKQAKRLPSEEFTHWNAWGQKR